MKNDEDGDDDSMLGNSSTRGRVGGVSYAEVLLFETHQDRGDSRTAKTTASLGRRSQPKGSHKAKGPNRGPQNRENQKIGVTLFRSSKHPSPIWCQS